MKRIKVLFAIPSLDRGGPDRVLFEILRALDRTQFEPFLMVSEPKGHYLAQLPADVHVEVLGPEVSLGSRYPMWRALRVIWRLQPDVILSTLRMNFTVGLISPAFRRGTSLVIRQANDFTTDFEVLIRKSPVKQRVARLLSLFMFRSADAIVCQSLAMRADLQRVLGDARSLHAISNPVDIDAVAAAAAERQIILPGRPALISTGRFMPQKGYDILLSAVAIVRVRYPQLHLTILGDGPDRAKLEQQARELGVTDVVTFAGFSGDVLPTVRAADLFVLASRYEGFPNAALEALACGTPVVLTDCPGASSEIVVPGLNGRLATSVDARAVAIALETAIAELPTYDRKAIVANTRQRYASSQIVAQYERVLASVTKPHMETPR